MPISIMLKPASSKCNLSCEYCFYKSVSTDREDADKGIMSYSTAENVIKSAIDFCKDSIFFTFQGGEPLVAGIDFFKNFVDCAKKTVDEKVKVNYCLQTNGTLINEEWCKFFKENNFLIGVSLDGDRELNTYRKYPNGNESFDDVLRGIELLKSYNVPFNILSVLTPLVANNVRKAYRFFKLQELNYMQFIPCLKPFDSDDNQYSMSNDDYAQYLNSAFKIYYNDNMRGLEISIRQMDNYRLLLSGKNAEQCGMNGMCSSQFVVEGDGSVYPCDFYCTDEWCLGNINEIGFKELFNTEKAVNFMKESFKLNDECKNCKYFALCRGGGCKRNREAYNYCVAYKDFFGKNLDLIKRMP